jgi:dTMP kinase
MARRPGDHKKKGKTSMNYHIEFDLDFKRNPYKGKFIVLEGVDAAGKTTHVRDLAANLRKYGEEVFLTKNPTDGEIGQFIRRVLIGKTKIPRVSFQFLFSADRNAQQADIIKHLKLGKTVISDRYFWSAIAYGLTDREDVEIDRAGQVLLYSQSVLAAFDQHILPDMTIFLDIPVAIAVNRLKKMDKVKELYEDEDKLAKIYKAYMWLIKRFPQEFTRIDGTKPEKEVSEEVLALVSSFKK